MAALLGTFAMAFCYCILRKYFLLSSDLNLVRHILISNVHLLALLQHVSFVPFYQHQVDNVSTSKEDYAKEGASPTQLS
jgi:hypothetical protein